MVNIKSLLQFTLGVLIIGIIVYFLDIKELMGVLTKINLGYFALAMLAYFSMNVIFAIRLRLIFKHVKKPMSFRELIFPQLGGMLASDITPGRSGYMVLPFLIKHKVPLESGFSAIFSAQIIDFSIKIIGAVIGIWYISTKINLTINMIYLSIIGIFLIIFFASIMLFLLMSKKSAHILKILSKLPVVKHFFSEVGERVEAFQSEGKLIRRIYPQLLLWTLLTWVAKGLEWYFLALAVGITIFPFWVFFLLQPLITVLQFVPITPGGLGFQEGAGFLILILLGVANVPAFILTILVRMDMILINLLGLPLLIKKGINVFEIKDLSKFK